MVDRKPKTRAASPPHESIAALDWEGIGRRLRDARKGQCVTQRMLGAFVGCSNVTILNVEKARCAPGGELLHRLCMALGRDINWILYGRNEETIP